MENINQKRKKKRLIIIVSVLLVFFLLGFYMVGQLIYTSHLWHKYGDSMLTMAMLLIEDFQYTSHDDIHIEDFDDYGRYLFSVDAWPYANVVYIIVQKNSGDNFVCYYEESCVAFLDNIKIRLTEEEKTQLEQLKEQNDWNRPLQEEKMTKVAIKE